MVYLLKMVIFHGYVSHNQRVHFTSFYCFDGSGKLLTSYHEILACKRRSSTKSTRCHPEVPGVPESSLNHNIACCRQPWNFLHERLQQADHPPGWILFVINFTSSKIMNVVQCNCVILASTLSSTLSQAMWSNTPSSGMTVGLLLDFTIQNYVYMYYK